MELLSEVWLLTRISRTYKIEVIGIFSSKKDAQENVDVLPGQGWEIYGPMWVMGGKFLARPSYRETARL
jgi:hypothetical protein